MLTKQQKQALQAAQRARARIQRERERDAVRRVKAYRRWLARGSVLRDIPPIPTDADFVIARRKGVVR